MLYISIERFVDFILRNFQTCSFFYIVNNNLITIRPLHAYSAQVSACKRLAITITNYQNEFQKSDRADDDADKVGVVFTYTCSAPRSDNAYQSAAL
jgi:hypothetical protein